MLSTHYRDTPGRIHIHVSRPLEPGEELPELPGLFDQIMACGEEMSRLWLERLADDIEVSELDIGEVLV
jgi:hypothetical protein